MGNGSIGNRLRYEVKKLPVRFADAVGASDGRWFADDGIEIVNFGPGGGSEGHAANEFILASELEESAAIHLEMVARTNGFVS
jgi:acetylornithine deacetylase/succinyl-diaminopimelate desuccinylase-like protein